MPNDGAKYRIRVGLVDDHQVLLDALGQWLSSPAHRLDLCISTSSFRSLLDHPAYPPDVVLLDLDLRDSLPVAVKLTTLRLAGVAPVVISSFGQAAHVRECMSAGALGFVPKDAEALAIVDAVRSAHAGKSFLTPELAQALVRDDAGSARPRLSAQEERALVLYASGLPLKSVARRMGVGYETAKSYLDRVRVKYEACGREARSKVELRQRAEEDRRMGGSSRGADLPLA